MAAPIFQRTVVDEQGNIVAGAVVEVRNEATNELAPIFVDRPLTEVKANPFTTDSTGFIRFFAAAGDYRIKATFGEEEIIFRFVQLIDTDELIDLDSAQSLQNKTIAFGSNTLTNVARTDAAQTLTGNQTITGGNLFLGGATSIDETLNGQIRTASTVVLQKDTPNVPPGGTRDLTVNTATLFGSPGGFAGILSVSAVRANFVPQSTKTVFVVVARGTTHTFTPLQSLNGSGGGIAFTLTMPSNGVIRFTDTSGSGSSILAQMSFVGTLTAT